MQFATVFCLLASVCASSAFVATRSPQATITTPCRASTLPEDEGSARRKFLSQALVAGLVVVQSPSEARAEKVVSAANKVTTPANRKLGGLSNKIRNIGNVMVGVVNNVANLVPARI